VTSKVDKMALDEVVLYKAYHKSIAETAALTATIDTLTKQLDDAIVFLILPMLDPIASTTVMEEIMM
jgi:hypothetical protein